MRSSEQGPCSRKEIWIWLVCGFICLLEKAQYCSVLWSSHYRGLGPWRIMLRSDWLPSCANLTKQMISYQLLWHPVNWRIGKGGSGLRVFSGHEIHVPLEMWLISLLNLSRDELKSGIHTELDPRAHDLKPSPHGSFYVLHWRENGCWGYKTQRSSLGLWRWPGTKKRHSYWLLHLNSCWEHSFPVYPESGLKDPKERIICFWVPHDSSLAGIFKHLVSGEAQDLTAAMQWRHFPDPLSQSMHDQLFPPLLTW